MIDPSELVKTCISSKVVELSDGIRAKLSPAQLEIIDRRTRDLEFLAFRYSVSSGAISAGFAIASKSSDQDKLPVIIYLRGGTRDFGVINAGTMYLQLAVLAELGYIVIGTQYTGNSLGSGTDTWGGEDLDAVMYLHEIIAQLDRVNNDDVTMIGGSRGAAMMYMALKKGFQAKRAISLAGVSDLSSWIEAREDMRDVFSEMFGDDMTHELNARSAVRWVNELPKQIKYTLIHGSNDLTVPLIQSEKLAELMDREGLNYDLHVLADYDHHITVSTPAVLDILKQEL